LPFGVAFGLKEKEMSVHSRSGATGAKGTHYQNPLMVSGGPLDDCPRGIVDGIASPYKIWYEDFREPKVNGEFELSGWTVTDTGGGSPTEVVGIDGSLCATLDLSATADDGVELQFDNPPDATADGDGHQVIPEITSSATLMDGKEIFFQVRMATNSDSAATNDVKYLLGIFVKDTALLSTTTGLPTVGDHGGFGFHKAEAGAVTCVSSVSTITTAGTAMAPAVSELADTANTDNWHTYAARLRLIDASAGTGVCDFWYDNIHRLRLSTTTMDDVGVYSFSIAACNGPAAPGSLADIKIDYVLTGITRPGLTWPYTDGVIY
jgi:hypothetical protein